jgi:pyruvate,orthophosphate dikinase
MDGLPVNIRLLDPPLHEFLPDRTELAVRVALPRPTANPVRSWKPTGKCLPQWRICTSRIRCWGCAACAWAW